MRRIDYEILRNRWGDKFLAHCLNEALIAFGNDPSMSELIAVAIGEIADQLVCPKCGSAKNVHCFTITENPKED